MRESLARSRARHSREGGCGCGSWSERPACGRAFGWRLGPRYGVYQSGFDPVWAEHEPGMMVIKDTVRAAVGEDAEDFDMLLGGESYKWRFAPSRVTVRTPVLVGAWRPLACSSPRRQRLAAGGGG